MLFQLYGKIGPRLCRNGVSISLADSSSLAKLISPQFRTALSAALSNQLSIKNLRHKELSEKMLDPALSPDEMAKFGRELGSLEKVVKKLAEFEALQAEHSDLVSLQSEADRNTEEGREMLELIEGDLSKLSDSIQRVEEELTGYILQDNTTDSRDVILEVRMGVGGDEACLFAKELWTMYESYAALKGWSWKPMVMEKEEGFGGLKEGQVSIGGEGAFGLLRFESGVHRVQRVPITQSTGKLQTSTATVAVLPEAEEVDIEIKPSDLRIDTYRAGGKGGQHVNTTDSAVRITHLPSGLVVANQDERSQQMNRNKAMRILRARLFEIERSKKEAERFESRKGQLKNSERSERIRTYNYTQTRITDHRIGESCYDMASFLRGEHLDHFFALLKKQEQQEFIEALEAESRRRNLSN